MDIETSIEKLAITAIQFDRANQLAEARQYSLKVLSAAKTNPKLLRNIKESGLFGKCFLLMFEQGVSDYQNDLQLISELSYFFLSKGIEEHLIKSQLILDRIILLFNSEDFIKDTMKRALNMNVNILSRLESPQMINHKLNDYLDMMRIADLEDENAIYGNIDFLKAKKRDYDKLIAQQYYGKGKTKDDIISLGRDIHEKISGYIQNHIESGLNLK